MIIAYGIFGLSCVFLIAFGYSSFNFERMIDNGALDKDTTIGQLHIGFWVCIVLSLGTAQYIWGQGA